MSRLRSIRRANDVTQVQVAQALGCSMSHYGNLERGLAPATPEHRRILGEFFSMPEEVLFEGLPEWNGPHPIPGVQTARVALGLSQYDLAKRCRCAQNTISKIENGLVAPSPALRERLSAELHVDQEELFRDLDKQVLENCDGKRWHVGIEAALNAEAKRQDCHPAYLRMKIEKRKWGYLNEESTTSPS